MSIENSSATTVEFEAFYDAMGEGVLASFIDNGESKLFDRQGLQHYHNQLQHH